MKKLHILAFIIPIIIVFIGSTAILQTQLTHWLLDRVETDVHNQANTLKNILEVTQLDREIPELDIYIDEISAGSPFRFTIIGIDGTVKADSWLTLNEIYKAENHADRPEIIGAKNDGYGTSTRYSNTIKSNLMYVAIPFLLPNFNGFIRVSVPLIEIDKYIYELDIIFASIAFIVLIVIFFLVVFAIRQL